VYVFFRRLISQVLIQQHLITQAQFRRRTFHEPNLIRIWNGPN